MRVGNGFTPHKFNTYASNEHVKAVSISSAYPNPFNPVTTINYIINQPSNLKIAVYDIAGRQVDLILNNEFKTTGEYKIHWNASNNASGIYYIQVKSDFGIETKKVVLLK